MQSPIHQKCCMGFLFLTPGCYGYAVRLFLSEESPSQVRFGSQDHLQAKTSWLLHSTGLGSDDNLPPGSEGAYSANLLKNTLAPI
ncbi:hypothetical protein F0562_010903 [Nyssa sinensis]|uniref:Uncharacterized protein n=1 Tax=Nyssa sinensis TaxID=561372 RepID=A0A5J5A1Z8_9ASTE|nr:hypothetical protein F0562_010903 [Nyssa sinensis]